VFCMCSPVMLLLFVMLRELLLNHNDRLIR
jgi:hypothetical protein